MPIAITDEQLALQSSIREWAKRAGTIEVVRSQEHTGLDETEGAAERWQSLADLGVFAIALPAAIGGAGATTADLAAVLAQVTESLVPGPVMPTLLAGLILARCSDQPGARAFLRRVAVGEVSVAVALGPESVGGEQRSDGSLVLPRNGGPGTRSRRQHALAHPRPRPGRARRHCLVPAARRPSGHRGDRQAPRRFLAVAGRRRGRRCHRRTAGGAGGHLDRRGTGSGSGAVRGRGGRGCRLVRADGGRVRRHPAAVRPRHRLVSGGQAPVRAHAVPGRSRLGTRLGCGPRRRRSPGRAAPHRRGCRGVRARRRRRQRQGLHPGPGRHRLYLGARRAPVPAAGAEPAPAARRHRPLAGTGGGARAGGHAAPADRRRQRRRRRTGGRARGRQDAGSVRRAAPGAGPAPRPGRLRLRRARLASAVRPQCVARGAARH